MAVANEDPHSCTLESVQESALCVGTRLAQITKVRISGGEMFESAHACARGEVNLVLHLLVLPAE